MSSISNQPTVSNQQLVNQIIALIKRGDIDQVVAEIERSGVERSQLNDDANFKQHLIFTCSVIPDDSLATKMGNVLKKMGINPGQVDTLSQTPLYYACREGKLQFTEWLLQNGCNVNHIDTYGQNPIFYACREGKLETVKKLINHNSHLDLVDNNGQTPLFYAVKHGRVDVVELLLTNGARPNVVDNKGNTPIALAKRANKHQVIDMLVKHGAPPIQDQSQKNKAKKQVLPPQPPKPKVNERKIPQKYQLTILKDGCYQPVTEAEFEQLKAEYPEISQYFDQPEGSELIELLPIPEVAESAPIYDSWDKAAMRLLNNLWKHSNAWIFHEPVDPVKLNILDYFDIIKQPMDLSTVKQKLKNNEYLKLADFLHDVQLIFDNCLLYNKETKQVTLMCTSVKEEFEKQYHVLNLDFYV
jgi:Bromodomain/Ankyrin repeats (3 copies)